MNQQKSLKIDKLNIQKQLIEMGFSQQQIQSALLVTQDKQSAIQYIMSNNQPLTNQIQSSNINQMQNEDDFQSDQEQTYKMIFLMRMDLKLGLGKMASQIANATLAAYKLMEIKKQQDELAEIAFYQWMQSGTKKIVVKVQSQEQLLSLIQKVQMKKINFYLCKSVASDQLNIAEGTITCAAIGPAQQNVLDALTGHLKLL